MDSKVLLVTGGAGFIGSNFILYMMDKYTNYRIINLDSLTYAGNPENLAKVAHNKNYEFIHGDICNKILLRHIFEENDIDFIINFAAESHVDRSISEPEIFVKTNILGTTDLLNVAKDFWGQGGSFKEGKKFVQISTDEVYGTLGNDGYFTENTPINPHSPYSSSKAGADLLVKAYFDTYKMPVNITRCSNNYGPYQFPEKLIPLMINNALQMKPLPIYGDGLNIRDWIYVQDHCRAIDLVLHKGMLGEIYNIGGHNERTNITIVKTILKYLGENVDKKIDESLIDYVEDRKGHDFRYAINPEKINRELGWSPSVPFEDGIISTIKWYIDNKQWMDNITTGEYQDYYLELEERCKKQT